MTLPLGTRPPINTMSIFGWVIIQKKALASGFNWNRSWSAYVNGFGSAGSDFWIGLERMALLTSSGGHRLRVEVKQKTTGKWYSAEYTSFSVGDANTEYTLHVNGFVQHCCGAIYCLIIRHHVSCTDISEFVHTASVCNSKLVEN